MFCFTPNRLPKMTNRVVQRKKCIRIGKNSTLWAVYWHVHACTRTHMHARTHARAHTLQSHSFIYLVDCQFCLSKSFHTKRLPSERFWNLSSGVTNFPVQRLTTKTETKDRASERASERAKTKTRHNFYHVHTTYDKDWTYKKDRPKNKNERRKLNWLRRQNGAWNQLAHISSAPRWMWDRKDSNYKFVCMHSCICVRMEVCMHECMHVFMYVSLYVCVHVFSSWMILRNCDSRNAVFISVFSYLFAT